LYYYDEIGLLSASERTTAGHRRYTEDDVRRLYRIRALTQLGLSLDEVAVVLRRGAEDLTALRDLLHEQLADLDAKARRLDEMRRQVLGLVEQLDGAVLPEPERFLAALELAAPFTAHFSERQRDALADRRAELGADTIDALRAQWLTILAGLRDHMTRGTPVEDAEVQELVAGWQRIGETFRTGREHLDKELGAAADAMWQQHRTRISQHVSDGVDWLAPDDMTNIMDYLNRARGNT
jgi:DNA-binding transcriptional MerR regulator